MMKLFALAIVAAAVSQTAPVPPQSTGTPQPTPTATPVSPAAKSINEAGPRGPAPSRPKPRPTTKPGVKFGE